MCGIAGIVTQGGSIDPETLKTAAERLSHRGPDGHGFHLADNVGLVHTRLSIIDLAGGRPPILSSDGQIALVANGEIYNFVELREAEAVPSPVFPARLLTEPQARPGHPWLAPGQPPVILGMGELGWRKDFATLVRAFAQVRQHQPCRLLILGKGRQREELARILGVAEDVELPGFQPNPYGFLAHAAVFALSSRWEGLSFALVEALAVGIPSVATDCPSGSREILQDGRYGPLVPVGDAEALADALRQTPDHPLPKATRQEAARPYEIERSASAYLRALGLDPRSPE
jgi:glycosyltransferase involved in cell wall biosynthesis